jgi:GNAT superfamily N-acetyltransferase
VPTLRPATVDDIPTLRALIDLSVRILQAGDYSREQLDAALSTVYGVDTQLIHDGTYFAVEHDSALVACGGWSKRRTLYGSDHALERDDSLLDPATDAARIRAFFVHPAWTRRGIGTLILEQCEAAAATAGFTRCELGSTLTGIPLYSARGYEAAESIDVPIGGSLTLRVVRMTRSLGIDTPLH